MFNKMRLLRALFVISFLFSAISHPIIIFAETVDTSAATKTTNRKVNPTSSFIEKQFTVKKVTGLDGLLLTGANSTQNLYLPIPQNWKVNSIKIQFAFFSSSLISIPSTLTAFINNKPINLLRLTDKFNINNGWTLTVPSDLIKTYNVNITLNNILDDYGNYCYNLSNPRFWLYIGGNSLVTYQYQTEDFHPNLSKFPYPFINTPAVEKDAAVIVLPDEPTLENYTAAFYLVNSLMKKASWLGTNLIATTVSQITDEQKANYNLIYIGTSNKLNLANLPIKWPLEIKSQILDDKHVPIMSDTGVIMLNQSPWNPKNAVLTITGETDQAVIKAANILRDPTFPNSVLFNQYALINEEYKPLNSRAMANDLSFSDLDFPDQLIYGSGQDAINYEINLPMDKIIKGLNLSIDYSTSPFLSEKERSYLTLLVNNNPIDGVKIDTTTAKTKNWKIHVDGHNLHNGANKISFLFNLYNENIHCKPEDGTLLWAKIYNTSTLHVELDKNNFLNFQTFKASPNNLIISIPEENSYFKSSYFAQQVLNISKDLPQINEVSFIYNKDLNIEASNNANLFYIGDVNSNKNLTPLFDAAHFLLEKNELLIDPLLKPYIETSYELPLSLYEIVRSPINQNKILMLVIANDTDGFKNSIDLFTNEKKNTLIDGNAVLLYQNGTFVSVKANQLIAAATKKSRIKSSILYGLGFLILLIFLVIISRKIYFKIKDYLTPKNK